MSELLTVFDTDYNADSCYYCGGRNAGLTGMCYHCQTGAPRYSGPSEEFWKEQDEKFAKVKEHGERFYEAYKAAKSDTDRRYVMLRFYPNARV